MPYREDDADLNPVNVTREAMAKVTSALERTIALADDAMGAVAFLDFTMNPNPRPPPAPGITPVLSGCEDPQGLTIAEIAMNRVAQRLEDLEFVSGVTVDRLDALENAAEDYTLDVEVPDNLDDTDDAPGPDDEEHHIAPASDEERRFTSCIPSPHMSSAIVALRAAFTWSDSSQGHEFWAYAVSQLVANKAVRAGELTYVEAQRAFDGDDADDTDDAPETAADLVF